MNIHNPKIILFFQVFIKKIILNDIKTYLFFPILLILLFLFIIIIIIFLLLSLLLFFSWSPGIWRGGVTYSTTWKEKEKKNVFSWEETISFITLEVRNNKNKIILFIIIINFMIFILFMIIIIFMIIIL